MSLDNQIILAESLKLQGYSYKEIALKLGVSISRAFQYIKPPKIIRELVIQRCQNRCEKCQNKIRKYGNIHHLLNPLLDLNHPSNLQYLCHVCHICTHWHISPEEVEFQAKSSIKDIDLKIFWHFRMNNTGMPISKLAEAFGVSERIINKVLKTDKDDYVDTGSELDKAIDHLKKIHRVRHFL
jgi:predicted transcriptional regulator